MSAGGSSATCRFIVASLPANAGDFRFLPPGARLAAFSQNSATLGRRRLVRRVVFGECNTQKLIPRDLAENPSRLFSGPLAV